MGAEEAPFLGVSRSIGGRRWHLRAGDERVGLALAQRLGLPEVVGRLMAARGVDLDGAEAFLSPTLKAWMPDPSSLLDMDRAAGRLARAVMAGEGVAVFGDYDVDGATSAALLIRFLRALGRDPLLYVPDRMAEGYGPNAAALLKLGAAGARLVVTVDCGATAHAPLEAARDAGIEVIVCDHHIGESRLPPAVAVVNPNRFDESSPLRSLAAVGVVFLLAVATNRALRAAGWFADGGRREPDLLALLDLVALGTVCDVVALTGLNRAFTTQGLKVLAQRRSVGLAALADVAGLDATPDAYHLGYLLGPRINAGGRVGKSDLGARLLATDDPAEARALAEALNHLNAERRALEAAAVEAALADIDAAEAAGRVMDEGLVFAVGEGWHPGIVGIVAARLKERYNRPAIAVATDDGFARGSGRSVAGIDLGGAMVAARQAGLVASGGGHAMAAGFSGPAERLEDLKAFLAARLVGTADAGALVPKLGLDAAIECAGATHELVASLARLAPFGSGHAEPRFVIRAARIVKSDTVGDGHVRCVLTGAGGGRLKAIAFRAHEGDLGRRLLARDGRPLHLAGALRPDAWTGPTAVQLIIDDAAEVTGDA